MIFLVQRYLEDYLERRGLIDNDQYAVKVANLYAAARHASRKTDFRRRLGRIQTVFFRANPSLARAGFQMEPLSDASSWPLIASESLVTWR
ncbi:MAG: hypothetical protein ACREX4_15245 [Gammaproteobacteria bacterium]